ncbi:hypothetical protein ACROYT_G018739 [Oculina patagonica]
MDSILEPITETDEHNFCVEMMKRLDTQRMNEQFCDVILEVGSGDDQARLKAHRIVLCAASPFFYNALNSDMKEKKEGVIRLEETSKAVMEEVLEYLYTGHVDINEHNVFDFIAAADFFFIPSLKALCSKFIVQTLCVTNCMTAYYFAVKYRCEEIQKNANDFILANFVAVAETEDFLNLSSKQVEEWIANDEIVVKGEEEVFEILRKWIKRNENEEQSFYDLFRHIRCIYVPRDYLSNVILPVSFVKNNLDCSNLALDAMKMVFSGQEECYFTQPPRDCLKTHEDAIVAVGTLSTLCYIPSEHKWYKLSDMQSIVHWNYPCQVFASCRGKLFRIGGIAGCPAEHYYPLGNTWFPLKSFHETIRFCSVVTFQGLLYVIGGLDKDNNRLSTVQRYNPDTNEWQLMPSLSCPRSSVHVCAVADGNHLYAIGGRSPSRIEAIAERFDPRERAWSRIASTQKDRVGAGGAALNQKVFVFGGLKSEDYSGSGLCEMYDPVTDVWSNIASTTLAPRGDFIYISAVSFKGKIFVCGEFKADDPRQAFSL